MTQHTSTDKDEADRAESLNQLLADGGDRQAAEKYLDLAAKMFNGIEGLTPVERNRLVQAAATLSINALQRAAQSDEPGEISALVALVTTTQTVLGYAATCEEPEGEADFDKVEGILGYVPDLLAAAAEIRFGEPDAPSRLVEPEVGTGNYL